LYSFVEALAVLAFLGFAAALVRFKLFFDFFGVAFERAFELAARFAVFDFDDFARLRFDALPLEARGARVLVDAHFAAP
jgi:hypothetical protein